MQAQASHVRLRIKTVRMTVSPCGMMACSCCTGGKDKPLPRSDVDRQQ